VDQGVGPVFKPQYCKKTSLNHTPKLGKFYCMQVAHTGTSLTHRMSTVCGLCLCHTVSFGGTFQWEKKFCFAGHLTPWGKTHASERHWGVQHTSLCWVSFALLCFQRFLVRDRSQKRKTSTKGCYIKWNWSRNQESPEKEKSRTWWILCWILSDL
jgi:hypothetical protein